MKNFVLCGHTGSSNRGSDAIVKSTADLITSAGGHTVLATYNYGKDQKFGFGEYHKVIRYVDFATKPFSRCITLLLKLLKNEVASVRVRQRPVVSFLKKAGVSISVGGDTYCYRELPVSFMEMNYACHQNGIPSVLWACSVEREKIALPVIYEDLKRYELIFPREVETYQALLEAGFPAERLVKMCDPAFTLVPEPVALPALPQGAGWIGINISPIAYGKNKTPALVKENYRRVIQHVLDTSEDSVLLIPHVYQIEEERFQEDWKLEKEMWELFQNNPLYKDRVVWVNQFYNSKQLKYIISQCKVLVAARTHASIAGYSSCVPTLVVGYSVKAVGIAKDLFGTDENYVIWARDIAQEDDLLQAYQWVAARTSEIKAQLEQVIPQYQKQAMDAASFLVHHYQENIEEKEEKL